MSKDLFERCSELGLQVLRVRHPLGAGTVIVATLDGEVQWEGPSVTDCLAWLDSMELHP